MPLVLGTNCIDHDACWALIRDGAPVFVYEHERFNRVKNGHGFGVESLWEGLRDHQVALEDVDLVTNLLDEQLMLRRPQLFLDAFGDTPENRDAAARASDHAYRKAVQYRARLQSLGFRDDRIVPMRHHLGHCAAAFYPSPYQEAAILTIDGSGEAETCAIARAEGRDIEILWTIPWPHSIGHVYYAVTRWLGWGYGEEGKTMALAAYGRPRFLEEFDEHLIQIADDGSFRMVRHVSARTGRAILEGLFGPTRANDERITQLHRDVAATVQQLTERIVVLLARKASELTGSRNLLLSGGVGLNSVANGAVLRERTFDNFGAYPQANDAGVAIGGALYAYYQLLDGHLPRAVLQHAFWGKEIDEGNVPARAAELGLPVVRRDDIVEATADLLARGSIVGWVQGRAEIGPRALGNRSILASPLEDGVRNRINATIKFREDWRPFAPSVLEEDAAEFFETAQPLPWMLAVVGVRPQWSEALASIRHADGMARIQTVSARQNERFHRLLEAFKLRTGIGVLLNTSFNVRGEPLVQTAEQALHDFLRTDLDALVIGDHLFTEKPAGLSVPAFTPFVENLKRFAHAGSLLLVVPDGGCTYLATLLAALPREAGPVTVAHGLDEPEVEGVAVRGVGSIALDPPRLPRELVALAAGCDNVCLLLPQDPVEYGHFGDRPVDETPLALGRRLSAETGRPVWYASWRGSITGHHDVEWLWPVAGLLEPQRISAAGAGRPGPSR